MRLFEVIHRDIASVDYNIAMRQLRQMAAFGRHPPSGWFWYGTDGGGIALV